MTKINLDELRADRNAGTDGPWRFDGDWHRLPTILSGPCNEICTVKKRGFPSRSDHTKAESANARRIARLPDLEAAYLEAVEALKVAEDAIAEMFRYYDGGETRGSYDGRPERDGLRRAGYKARAALARLT